MREVVITGMGLISCIGNDLETVSKNLKAGKSGIKLNQEYVDMGFRSHVCGSIDIDLKPLIDRKVLRFFETVSKSLPIQDINPIPVITTSRILKLTWISKKTNF